MSFSSTASSLLVGVLVLHAASAIRTMINIDDIRGLHGSSNATIAQAENNGDVATSHALLERSNNSNAFTSYDCERTSSVPAGGCPVGLKGFFKNGVEEWLNTYAMETSSLKEIATYVSGAYKPGGAGNIKKRFVTVAYFDTSVKAGGFPLTDNKLTPKVCICHIDGIPTQFVREELQPLVLTMVWNMDAPDPKKK